MKRIYIKSVNDGMNFLVEGVVAGANDLCTFMRAKLLKHFPIPVLQLDSDSRTFQHEPPSWESITAVIELCSGFGGMAQGISACGFHSILAVDFNERMCNLYKQQGAADAIVGDVCSDETVCRIWHHAKGAGTIAAGFACQPFSRLGDQLGHLDSRAQSLQGVLETAFYLQSQVLILECVTAAASNAHVKTEIQKFLDLTGFNCCQIDLNLHDIWPSRRSRAWWLISASFLGTFQLVPWPRSDALTRVRQVISCLHPWDASDEQALALLPSELSAFGFDSDSYIKYLLNFEGSAPCALHSWGSQVVACECGCRSAGLSFRRLQEKGLFGLLVRSAASDQQFVYRHIHPNECNALNGFDPVLDFHAHPRLVLAASGQMASPLQTAWIFAHVAERLHQLRNDQMSFSAPAVLQALISWTLMRCRKVWPSDVEHVKDVKLASLMAFWQGYDHLSIHELMHPPRWPAMPDRPICIASVLDWIIRESQSRQQIPLPVPPTVLDEVMPVDDTPTPWFESQETEFGDLPQVSPHECIVVFKHEFSDPVKLVVSAPCTVHDMLQAHVKLVGDFQVIQVCNQHGVALSMSHQMQLGEIFFVRCEDVHSETFVPDQHRESDMPALVSIEPAAHELPPVESAHAPLPVVSPTAAWTHPIHEPTQPVHSAMHDVGECEIPSQMVADSEFSDFCCAAAGTEW